MPFEQLLFVQCLIRGFISIGKLEEPASIWIDFKETAKTDSSKSEMGCSAKGKKT
jgi:hypothetical protein